MFGTDISNSDAVKRDAMRNNVMLNAELGRLVNRELTNRLIKLHTRGYDLDFGIINNQCVGCLQNQELFACDEVVVRLVDQVYDFITNSFKYVHTVDTSCGKKGIMVIEGIYCFHQKMLRGLSS